MKRFLAMVIMLIGIASLVLGIIFIVQSGSAKQEIADSLAPVTISEVNGKYDAVTAKQKAAMQAEEPKIQAGQAAPSASYNYLSAQRALLGLAKSNIGVASFLLMSGIVEIVLGIGLVLAGLMLSMKQTA